MAGILFVTGILAINFLLVLRMGMNVCGCVYIYIYTYTYKTPLMVGRPALGILAVWQGSSGWWRLQAVAIHTQRPDTQSQEDGEDRTDTKRAQRDGPVGTGPQLSEPHFSPGKALEAVKGPERSRLSREWGLIEEGARPVRPGKASLVELRQNRGRQTSVQLLMQNTSLFQGLRGHATSVFSVCGQSVRLLAGQPHTGAMRL